MGSCKYVFPLDINLILFERICGTSMFLLVHMGIEVDKSFEFSCYTGGSVQCRQKGSIILCAFHGAVILFNSYKFFVL